MAGRGMVIAIVVQDLVFAYFDNRAPRDLNNVLGAVSGYYADMGSPSGCLAAACDALTTTTGWYAFSIALASRLVGRGFFLFAVVNGLWKALLLAGTLRIGNRIGGPPAGLAAVALLGTFQWLEIVSRDSWVHVPEAALVVTLTAAWLQDPGLMARSTRAVVAVAGAMTASLRASGVVWLAPMVVCLPLAASVLRRPKMPAIGVLACWIVAATPSILLLPAYVQNKLDSRGRYELVVDDALAQVVQHLGFLPCWLVGIGLVLWWIRLLAHRQRRWDVAWALPAGWLALAFGMALVLKSGLDNSPLYLVALALVAGAGLGGFKPASAMAPALGWMTLTALGWVPDAWADALHARLHAFPIAQINTRGDSALRPWRGFGAAQITSLLHATCPESGTCFVLTNSGVYGPRVEEPGRFETFLAGLDDLELRGSYEPYRPDFVSALNVGVSYACPDRDDGWAVRNPDADRRFSDVARQRRLLPVWRGALDSNCLLTWYTPGGVLAHPELLPPVPEVRLRDRPAPE